MNTPTSEEDAANSVRDLLSVTRDFFGEIRQLKYDFSNMISLRVFYIGRAVSEDILSKGNIQQRLLYRRSPSLNAALSSF